MIPQLSQETVTEYASEALTIQEPQGADYTKGVSVGKTIPAKWWNWLFNAVTKRVSQSKTDAQSMLDELKNVVTDAGLTPDAEDNTQLTQAVVAKANTEIDKYVYYKQGFFAEWQTVPAQTIPQGYAATRRISIDNSAICRIRYASNALTNEFMLSLNTDGTSWSEEVSVTLSQSVYANGLMAISFCVFKGRYFVILGGLQDTSYQRECYYQLFVSDDGLKWTSLRSMHIRFNSSNVNSSNPVLGLGEDALYLCTLEGVTGDITTHMLCTKDAYAWTELGSGFSYNAAPMATRVIPYGSNGFAWGQFLYDGVTVTRAFTPLSTEVYGNIPNPLIFDSGVVLYIPKRYSTVYYTAPYLGGTTTKHTGMREYAELFLTPDRHYVLGCIGSYSSGICDEVHIIDDTLTVTNMSQPPRQSSYTYKPFVKDGKIYCYRHTTTDLLNWTELSNLPPQSTVNDYLTPCLPPNVLHFVRYSSDTDYVSINSGKTWRVTSFIGYALKGSIFNSNCCFDSDSNLVTFTSINRVAGHTLYLR